MGHDERAGYFELPSVQLGAQGRQVGGEVTVRPQLGPLVTRLDQFVEVAVPGRLPRIAREPNSPVVRRAADLDVHPLLHGRQSRSADTNVKKKGASALGAEHSVWHHFLVDPRRWWLVSGEGQQRLDRQPPTGFDPIRG